MTAERWLPVVGWPTYEVSNHGRLRSLMCSHGRGGLTRRNEPRICKLRPAGNGYLRFRLQRNGETRSVPVHHLVLEAFVGARPDGFEAAHLDGDRANNAAYNLMWTTHAQNMGHQVSHGTLACGDANGNAILTAGRVEAARMLVAAGMSRAKVALMLKVKPGAIENIISGRTWKHLPPGYAYPDACGVMLALLREAVAPWTPPNATGAESGRDAKGWHVWLQTGPYARDRYDGPTEGAAIAAALISLAEALP